MARPMSSAVDVEAVANRRSVGWAVRCAVAAGAAPDALHGQEGDDTLYARDGYADTVDGGNGSGDSAGYDKGLDDVSGVEQQL